MFKGSHLFHKLYGAILGALISVNAQASIYVSGSISTSTSNVPFQTFESRYGSGSLGIDLGRFIRLGYTHSQELSVTEGYRDPNGQSQTRGAASSDVVDTCESCVATRSSTQVVGNSLDLQIILFEGQLFMPYITGGAIVKLYRFENLESGQVTRNEGAVGPVPNLGAGLGIRLNKDFTLKLTYIASPGLAQTKGEELPHGVWDKRVTLGLSYQI